jgi:hypothetical protein
MPILGLTNNGCLSQHYAYIINTTQLNLQKKKIPTCSLAKVEGPFEMVKAIQISQFPSFLFLAQKSQSK